MKYIITEEQFEFLNEMLTPSGTYDINVIQHFFSFVKYKLPTKKVIKITRKYFETTVGQDMSKYSDEAIESYLSDLSYPRLTSGMPSKVFKNNDVISNLAYDISKNFFKIEKSNFELKYIKVKQNSFLKYFFFDSDLNELVGVLETEKFYSNYSPKNSYKVVVSAVDKYVKGSGYGKNMYLTVINDIDVLFSDDMLYKESLNIWVNVLPKYLNNVGYIDSKGVPHKITNETKIPFDDISRFYAIK